MLGPGSNKLKSRVENFAIDLGPNLADSVGMKVSNKLRPNELRAYRRFRLEKADSLRQYRRWNSDKPVKVRNASSRYFTSLDFRTNS